MVRVRHCVPLLALQAMAPVGALIVVLGLAAPLEAQTIIYRNGDLTISSGRPGFIPHGSADSGITTHSRRIPLALPLAPRLDWPYVNGPTYRPSIPPHGQPHAWFPGKGVGHGEVSPEYWERRSRRSSSSGWRHHGDIDIKRDDADRRVVRRQRRIITVEPGEEVVIRRRDGGTILVR